MRIDQLSEIEYKAHKVKIELIKILYKEIAHGEKRKTIEMIADKVRRRPATLKNWWFSGSWEIPCEYVDQVFKLLMEYKKEIVEA